MTIVLFLFSLLFQSNLVYAQEIKPLYQIPDYISSKTEIDSNSAIITKNILIGSDEGLFKLTNNNVAIPLWQEGRVEQLLLINIPNSEGIYRPTWMIRTSKGIFSTTDLINFEERDNGLPFLTIKKYQNGEKVLVKQIQEIQDICANPQNNMQLVTATKDNVYFSRDGGLKWESLGSMSKSTAGNKAVAVATLENQTVIFMAHPIFGLSYILPDSPKPKWIDVADGFEKMPSLSSPDEISDILPVVRLNAQGKNI